MMQAVLVDGAIITNFNFKADLFNIFFVSRCSPLKNVNDLQNFEYKTDKRLNKISFNEGAIFTVIKSLNPNKAIKICGRFIAFPSKLIFKSVLCDGIFPDFPKKSNIVPIHKKENKNLLQYFRTIRLLPVFSKFFERNSLFFHFANNKLCTECQSGLLPGDSCISQLLSIIHAIHSVAFDGNPTVDFS